MPELPKNSALYYGNSMFRVFTPGDLLFYREIPFAEFRKGDIVAFYPPDCRKSGIVHRVISRTADSLTTMGDNNPAPDKNPVTIADSPKLVISRSLSGGIIRKVSRGRTGMFLFYCHRSRRFLRCVASRIYHFIIRH